MNFIISMLNGFFNLIFAPFNNLNPMWGLIVVSLITGVLMLYIFKLTSDQAGIKQAKNLVKGHFLAIYLYRDDISTMFSTLKNIVVSNFLYIKKSFRPMLFLIVPVGLIFIFVEQRYDHRPLRVGESTIVSIRLAPEVQNQIRNVEMKLPEGLTRETPAVRIESIPEISWRVKADREGFYRIRFELNGETIVKQLRVEPSLAPLATQTTRGGFFTALLNAAERSLPSEQWATAVSVIYPKRQLRLMGIHIHWLVAFFIFSIISAFAFRKFMKVEI